MREPLKRRRNNIKATYVCCILITSSLLSKKGGPTKLDSLRKVRVSILLVQHLCNLWIVNILHSIGWARHWLWSRCSTQNAASWEQARRHHSSSGIQKFSACISDSLFRSLYTDLSSTVFALCWWLGDLDQLHRQWTAKPLIVLGAKLAPF